MSRATGAVHIRTTATRRRAYADLIRRVHEVVESCTPPGADVVFASKGDDALIAVPGRSGMHLLRAPDGSPATYHPGHSEEIVRHLARVLRPAGADPYFVLPATHAWWLDYYHDLAEYLEAHGTLVADRQDTCRIYRLRRAPVVPAPDGAFDGPEQPPDSRILALVQALLPPAAVTAALGTDGNFRLLCGAEEDVAGVAVAGRARDLASLRAAGVEYVVIAAPEEGLAATDPLLHAQLQQAGRLVTRQRRVATIFALLAGDSSGDGRGA